MWTENYQRSDANHIAWINLIQSNTTYCAKLGLMKAQDSYIDTSTTQSTAPGLFGGFSFRCSKKLKGGDSWIHSTAQRKEHSETELEKKNSKNEFGESKTFYRSKFSRAIGVTLRNWSLPSQVLSLQDHPGRGYRDSARLLCESWWQKKWGAIRGKKLHRNWEIVVDWMVGVVGA